MNTPRFTAHDSLYRSTQHYAIGLISSWISPAAIMSAYKYPPGEQGIVMRNAANAGPIARKKTCTSTCRSYPYPKPCCASTESCCIGKCVNTTSDSKNCGACGNVCKSGTSCIDGACEKPCPPGRKRCGDSCVDFTYDALNCGACGVTCKTGICCAGTCGTDCHNGACCPEGNPYCDTPIGGRCCDNECVHSPVGNFNFCI